MRQYELRLSPQQGWFHPFERRIGRTDGVRRVAIHRIRLVGDELGMMLYELGGDFERAEELVDDELGSMGYWIDEFDGRIFVCSLFGPNETVRELLRVTRDFRVFLDPPLIYVRDGDLKVTLFATERSFQQARSVVPDDVELTLETKRSFDPEENVFLAKLTPRQRRLFETAIDLGYYGSPRETTYEEIGREVGIAGGTVGEHLRKIEAKLVDHVVSESVADTPQPQRIR
ncbi:helix-turn-helix domain-containing protein [Haloterrigena alkaliphila]|uniref:Helix-turn-helix domain-containing protein n=1 Tax=Haloterrigena alkaliphila TaxID=2816475 RepID=A0A8A2VE62_9EURY|nr:helix-turn-helix domain-containing protein [Haloterrigena alkaliphila]QSW99546.1 helix-turn-helix domain-containing protein [Haloterrigena alkaliphila]